MFELEGLQPKGTTCPGIDGIIKDANEVAGEIGDPAVLDAALTAAAQAVEHYEISRYGTLVTWARLLGRGDCADLLAAMLVEENATDDKLTRLATSRLNGRAGAGAA